jgi:L-threonylcarbamoyladenylate synthase
MSQPEPEFIVPASDRTPGGSLRVGWLSRIAEILLAGGYALIPSDTAYSVAAIPFASSVRTTINDMLHRGLEPVSLAFPSVPMVRQWIAPNRYAELVLEEYCPGPITVVCPASMQQPAQYFSEGMRAHDQTVGVRIPDSVVERDVAAATGFPISTVAVRSQDASKIALTSYDEALEVVENGVRLIGGTRWCVVQGDSFYPAHSTVVRVNPDGTVERIRDGDIRYGQVRDYVDTLAGRTASP